MRRIKKALAGLRAYNSAQEKAAAVEQEEAAAAEREKAAAAEAAADFSDFGASSSAAPDATQSDAAAAVDFSDFGNGTFAGADFSGFGTDVSAASQTYEVNPAGQHACAAIGCPTQADKLRKRMHDELTVAEPSESTNPTDEAESSKDTDAAPDTADAPSVTQSETAGWPRDDGRGMKVISADSPSLDAERTKCNASATNEFLPWLMVNSITKETKQGFVCGFRNIGQTEIDETVRAAGK